MQEQSAPLIFVHVPRTGGTTVWEIFRAALPGKVRRLALGDERKNELELNRLLDGQAGSLALIGGHVRLSAIERPLAKERIISFIRRPRERVISSWLARIEIQKRRGIAVPEDALLRFAKVMRFRAVMLLTGLPRGQLSRWNNAADVEEHARRLATLIDERVGFVGFLEHFDTSLCVLSQQLGWPSAPYYEERNRGGNKQALPGEIVARLDQLVRLEDLVYRNLLQRRLREWKRTYRFLGLRVLIYRMRCRLKCLRRAISRRQ